MPSGQWLWISGVASRVMCVNVSCRAANAASVVMNNDEELCNLLGPKALGMLSTYEVTAWGIVASWCLNLWHSQC